MSKLDKAILKASKNYLERIGDKIRKRELEVAMKAGIDNAIYQYPLKQHRPHSNYRRTGNLKKSVRYTRFAPGPANPTLKIKIVVSNRILKGLSNPLSKGRGYAGYTAYGSNYGSKGPNNTVMGLGWMPFSREHIIRFIAKDALKNGVF